MLLQPADEVQLANLKSKDFYQPPERVEEDITQLIEWLEKQPHLPNITDRKWLSNFITGCKYNLQRSKKVIESYFVVRSELPELFGSFTKADMEELTICGHMSLFPKLTPECNRVFCLRTHSTSDDYEMNIPLIIKVTIACLDLQIKDGPHYGNVILLDLGNVRLQQFLSITPNMAKILLRCTIEAFPSRIKEIHYVNPPKFLGRILNFFKLFLPNKMKERIITHETLDTLYKYIPKDVLPDYYGGTAGSIEKIENQLIENLLQNKEWLDNRPKADLSKCPVHVKSDDLGIDGTFKKLNVD